MGRGAHNAWEDSERRRAQRRGEWPACLDCRSPNYLRAWYRDPVAYDIVYLSRDETVFADTAPEIEEGGELDDYSCRNCGAVEIDPDDLVLVEVKP